MKLFGMEISRAEQRSAPPLETIASSATYDEFLRFFGLTPSQLPAVTIDSALQVPAVLCAVDFLGSCMGALPRHAYRQGKDENGKDKVERSAARCSAWSTRRLTPIGRRSSSGSISIRSGSPAAAAWHGSRKRQQRRSRCGRSTRRVTIVKRAGVRKIYEFNSGSRTITYDASEVIDLPFMLKADQLCSYSPMKLGERAIQLALAMNDYGSGFFAGGGVPPLALHGPLPQKATQAAERQAKDIELAIERARKAERPFFGMPPGHELKAVGIDPEKGQLVEARRFQVEEIARVYRLPPVFLQDLSRGTFSNTEQQDLNLVKHLIAQLARQCEDELNLKLFGATKNSRLHRAQPRRAAARRSQEPVRGAGARRADGAAHAQRGARARQSPAARERRQALYPGRDRAARHSARIEGAGQRWRPGRQRKRCLRLSAAR
jgi:phage portal protein BeeE